jgi:hypothetical protein
MYRIINVIAALIAWMLMLYGFYAVVIAGWAVFQLQGGAVQPGDHYFLSESFPDFWQAIEQISSGAVCLILGAGVRKLIKLRVASKLDDIT